METNKGILIELTGKQYLKLGDRIFIGSNSAVPNALVDQLIDDQATALNDIEIRHILTLGENHWRKRSIRKLSHSIRCF